MSRATYEQAQNDVAAAVSELVAEAFLRGADGLGEGGEELVAGTLEILGEALLVAAKRVAKDHKGGKSPAEPPDEPRGLPF